MSCSQKMMMFVIVMMGVLMVEEISAQECASALVPCAGYLNSTKPPESCCKPLRDTIKTQRKCLCDLYEDKNLLPSMGINVTQALLLPTYCGVNETTSLCSKVVPGGGGKNGATQMAWIGFSSLALFWAALLAY
ncbi:hypothetical protein MKW92_035738 [Papaver armeniacum]|nr:hypothetical protein MKW92_035738 [Papaver armeniacum]